MILRVTPELSARRQNKFVSPATCWQVETWNLAPHDDIYAPVCQVQIYIHKGVWYYWCAASMCQLTRQLGEKLAHIRNKKD